MSKKRNVNNSKSGVINTQVDIKDLIRGKPWLLPSNRKLRHLEGISLRNLTLSRPSAPSQTRTADGESLPSAFKSPTKILALLEKRLEHSRSSSDLRSSPARKTGPDDVKENHRSDDSLSLDRPNGRVRRRSTLNWANEPPQIRQQKLEDVAGSNLADTWFSLHCEGFSEPVYVSEVVERSMNLNFRFFDLNTYGPWVTRKDNLTVNLWARAASTSQYALILELQLNMRSLQFIGKTEWASNNNAQIESFHHPLPQNCLLLHLSDGIYTSFTDLPIDEPVLAIPTEVPNTHGVQTTSTFDELMRLSNLDDCIQDALATREKLTSQINSILQEQRENRQAMQAATQAQDSLASTRRAVSTAQKQIRAARARRTEIQANLQARRDAIRSGSLFQQKSRLQLQSARCQYADDIAARADTQYALTSQIQRICEDLDEIYPVKPVPRKALAFTILGLPLPNATSPSLDAGETAAALGCVAHATHLLSLYLSVALPYPITPYGSSSTIRDPVSTSLHSEDARTFPLYQKGAVTYRFEYGVFLLNSNIELLMSRQGIRIVDLRHTLPNLKYLFTVLTSSSGDQLRRKEGDVSINRCLDNDHTERKPRFGKERAGESNGILSKLILEGKEAAERLHSPLGRDAGYVLNKV
ncbi:MAG: hypothetical protein Q9220_003541 [cf. Caloplaca sp. 1 TL-2023]